MRGGAKSYKANDSTATHVPQMVLQLNESSDLPIRSSQQLWGEKTLYLNMCYDGLGHELLFQPQRASSIVKKNVTAPLASQIWMFQCSLLAVVFFKAWRLLTRSVSKMKPYSYSLTAGDMWSANCYCYQWSGMEGLKNVYQNQSKSRVSVTRGFIGDNKGNTMRMTHTQRHGYAWLFSRSDPRATRSTNIGPVEGVDLVNSTCNLDKAGFLCLQVLDLKLKPSQGCTGRYSHILDADL